MNKSKLLFIFISFLFKYILNDDSNIIKNLLKWAKNNKIYINEEYLKLNKYDSNHNLPYFSSIKDIPINTTLIEIPVEKLISVQSLIDLSKNDSTFTENKNLWDKIINIKNAYINFNSTKELFFIALMFEKAKRNKKNIIFKNYRRLFNIYKYTNLDNFPLFWSQEEVNFLLNSYFYTEIKMASESIENELNIAYKDLNLEEINSEEFIKQRVILLTNSFMNNNITYIIPFVDYLKKEMYLNEADLNSTFINNTFKIFAFKNITKNKDLSLLIRRIPNSASLLYYGFTQEDNLFLNKFMVEVVNLKFRNKIGFNEIKPEIKLNITQYNLARQDFINNGNNVYAKIKIHFEQYNKEFGEFYMMRDNLLYYKEVYQNFTDGKFNEVFYGREKIKNIKRVINLEKNLIDSRIDYLNNLIENNNNEKNKQKKHDL